MAKERFLFDDDVEALEAAVPVAKTKGRKSKAAPVSQVEAPLESEERMVADAVELAVPVEPAVGTTQPAFIADISNSSTSSEFVPVSLVGITIKNFLACSETIEVRIDPFTVLVGRNDVGKSMVLKALNALLGNGAIDSDSVCRFADSTRIEICGYFTPGTATMDIDGGKTTTFADEGLLDSLGRFAIKKVWDGSESKPKPEVWLYGPVLGDSLLTLTETQLRQRCTVMGIATNKGNGEEYNNPEKRRKITDHHVNTLNEIPATDWILIGTTGRRKTVWDGIAEVLPRFEYFKADSPLDGSDKAIQDYIRQQVTVALSSCKLDEIEKIVRTQLDGVLGDLTSKINRTVDEDDQIRLSTEFDWTKIVKTTFRTAGEDIDVPLSQRGDGFRRITMMSFFEHLAETRLVSNTSIIFGFEEPETFLHPKAQEQLFETIYGLSEAGYQVVLCTHSPILVANAPQASLVHVVRDGRRLSVKQDGLQYREIADDLGISMRNQFLKTFDTAKVLLLVEGIRDVDAFNHVASVYHSNGKIPATFSDLDIALVPIGGCDSIQHWVALDLMRTLQKPYFVWLDSDRTSEGGPSKPRETLLNATFSDGVTTMREGLDFLVARKRDIENYLPCAFLNAQVPGAMLTYGDFDDVKELCKRNPLNARLGGGKVANRMFPRMALADIEAGFKMPDGSDEFLILYEAVKAKLETNVP